MNRIRWFSIRLPQSIDSALKKIKGAPPFGGREFGFISVENDNSKINSFRFLKKSLIKVPILSKNGTLKYQDVESVDGLLFEIFERDSSIWLKIEDPPRSVRDLLNGLENILGFGFSAQPFVFSLTQQSNALLRCDSHQLIGVRCIGHSVSNKFIARIDIASKEGLEPQKLSILKNIDFKIDQTTYEATYNMLRGQITFTSSGLVRTNGAASSFLIDCVEAFI